MKRPIYVGLLFTACLAIGAAATFWLSSTILRLDREQRNYQQMAELEEKVRLALWRMDSALGPFIAAESMRPYNLYSAFYPATEAVDPSKNVFYAQPVLMPSPLLTFRSPYIRLHFQIDTGNDLTSPQVPDDEHLPLAQANYLAPGELVESIDRLVELKQLVHYDELVGRLKKADTSNEVEQAGAVDPSSSEEKQSSLDPVQISNNTNELFSRINQAIVQQQAPPLKVVPKGATRGKRNGVTMDAPGVGAHTPPQTTVTPAGDTASGSGGGAFGGGGTSDRDFSGGAFRLEVRPDNEELWTIERDTPEAHIVLGTPREWTEEPITPLWVDGEMLLVRPIRSGGLTRLQGCWLDWPAINHWLLGLCSDLLPEARLVAVTSSASADPEIPGRQLASLPVRLVPGTVQGSVTPHLSPVLVYLVTSVGGIAVATLAIAVLFWGAVALSERRAQFVSAVTHELRSPLTTFRLYTEMLAKGMITDGEKRQLYFETLHAEAGRLSHLVENVLAFARLERGRLTDRASLHPASTLLAGAAQRLEQRAAHGAMTLEVSDEAGDAAVRVDPDILEQILYNLVDNACKYAATGPDRRIHLQAVAVGSTVEFRVRDHGPGIPRRDARRIFRPFTKSVHEAARSAPGVGLGLGLSRRLARSAGGTLRLAATQEGACFVLTLRRHG